MKRTLCLIIVFGILSIAILSLAESNDVEITFLDIPWLSDISTVEEKLSENEYNIFFSGLSNQTENKAAYIIEDDVTLFRPYALDQFDAYTFSVSPNIMGKIGGYPVKNVSLTFAYDGETKLVAAIIELINSDYHDLEKKLSQKYGESIKNITDEGIETQIWRGGNNSAVMLYTESNGINYTLMYGRIDAEEILQSFLAPADPYDTSGL